MRGNKKEGGGEKDGTFGLEKGSAFWSHMSALHWVHESFLRGMDLGFTVSCFRDCRLSIMGKR